MLRGYQNSSCLSLWSLKPSVFLLKLSDIKEAEKGR
ncbi:unnamed protein product [Brassica oleracea var. botrytis]